jgi:hypothetical protein
MRQEALHEMYQTRKGDPVKCSLPVACMAKSTHIGFSPHLTPTLTPRVSKCSEQAAGRGRRFRFLRARALKEDAQLVLWKRIINSRYAYSFGLSVSHQETSKAAAQSWPEAPDEAGWLVVWPLTVSDCPLVSTKQDMIIIVLSSQRSVFGAFTETTPAASVVSCTFLK